MGMHRVRHRGQWEHIGMKVGHPHGSWHEVLGQRHVQTPKGTVPTHSMAAFPFVPLAVQPSVSDFGICKTPKRGLGKAKT